MPRSLTAATASVGETPIIVFVPWSKLNVITSGRSLARRMPSIAAVASSSAKNVSSTSRSAPPAASPRACSSNVAAHSSSESGPSGSHRRPVGAEGSRDQGSPGRRLARQLDGALVHLEGPPGEGRVLEPQPRRAERAGQDHVRPGVDERAMKAQHPLRLVEEPLLRGHPGLEPKLLVVRAGRAVRDQHPSLFERL